MAADSPIGAVIERNLHRSAAVEALRRLPGRVVEIFCRCEPAIAQERYRARTGTRHAGHFGGVRPIEELWNDEVTAPVADGWPLLEVDINHPVDLVEVTAFVRGSTT